MDLEQILTDGIDYTLSLIQYPGQSTANLFRIEGHLFYIITFYNPADNLTIAYDFNTKLFLNLTDQYFAYHPMRQVIYFNDRILFLSLNNASIYQLDSDITVIDENISMPGSSTYDPTQVFDIQYERITPSIRQEDGERFIVNSIGLTLEQGCDPSYTGANIEAQQMPIL